MQKARATLRWQACGVLLTTVSSGILIVCRIAYESLPLSKSPSTQLLVMLPQALDTVSNAVGAVCLSGALRETTSSDCAAAVEAAVAKREERRRRLARHERQR